VPTLRCITHVESGMINHEHSSNTGCGRFRC
jgi:hypothetical protein